MVLSWPGEKRRRGRWSRAGLSVSIAASDSLRCSGAALPTRADCRQAKFGFFYDMTSHLISSHLTFPSITLLMVQVPGYGGTLHSSVPSRHSDPIVRCQEPEQ